MTLTLTSADGTKNITVALRDIQIRGKTKKQELLLPKTKPVTIIIGYAEDIRIVFRVYNSEDYNTVHYIIRNAQTTGTSWNDWGKISISGSTYDEILDGDYRLIDYNIKRNSKAGVVREITLTLRPIPEGVSW